MKDGESDDDFKKRIIDGSMEGIIEGLPSHMKEDMKRALEKRKRESRSQKADENLLTKQELKKLLENMRDPDSIEKAMGELNDRWVEGFESARARIMEDEDFLQEMGDRQLNNPYSPEEIAEIAKEYRDDVAGGGSPFSKNYFRLRMIEQNQYGGDRAKFFADVRSSLEVEVGVRQQLQMFRERHGADHEARYILRTLFGIPCEPADSLSNKYMELALEKLKLYYSAYLGTDKGIETRGIIGFLMGYFELKRMFPDFENIHRGYLSSVVTDDITNPGTNVFSLRRGRSKRVVQSEIAGKKYNFVEHVEALHRIMARDGGCVVQNVQEFSRPYRPVEEGLANLEAVISAAFDGRGEKCLPIEYNRQQLQSVLKKSGISREVRQKIQGAVGVDGVPEENIRQVADEAKSCVKNALKELSTKRTAAGGHIEHLKLHDYLLPIYLRLDSPDIIKHVRTGRTLSTFLKLDPKMKTGRCTAGDGGYRQVSYQYGLDPAIQIVDLCFDSPQKCVAEAVLVSAIDMYENRDRITVVETVEAGEDAYLLPDYNGHPAWTYLLLDEIFRRSLGGGNPRIMFSTGVDGKPAINHFYRVVAELPGISEDSSPIVLPAIHKYPDKIDPEFDWSRFLTTARWREKSNSAPLKLEKEDVVEKLKQKYLDELEEQYRSSPTLQAVLSPKDVLRMGRDFLKNPKHLFSETYLGAWGIKENLESSTTGDLFDGASERTGLGKILDDPEREEGWVRFLRYIRNFTRRPRNTFQYKGGHININNGCGLVRGFVYEVTKERYDAFNEKMEDVRKHIGLVEV